MKCAVLHLAFRFLGAGNSSISLSNLGKICFPEPMRPYTWRGEFLLTPRLYVSYNCGVASYGDQLYMNFSRYGTETELESIFLRRIFELGHTPVIEVDGQLLIFQIPCQ